MNSFTAFGYLECLYPYATSTFCCSVGTPTGPIGIGAWSISLAISCCFGSGEFLPTVQIEMPLRVRLSSPERKALLLLESFQDSTPWMNVGYSCLTYSSA